jgi:hypothetical protein
MEFQPTQENGITIDNGSQRSGAYRYVLKLVPSFKKLKILGYLEACPECWL